MKLSFTDAAWDDYAHWQRAGRQVLERVNRLIADTMRLDDSRRGRVGA